MPYLTDSMLRNINDVPVSLPATRLTANTWLVVATIQLSGQVTASFNWLQLQLLDAIAQADGSTVDLSSQAVVANVATNNTNYGLAYVGIVKDLSSTSIDPATLQFIGTVEDVLTLAAKGVVARSLTAAPLEILAAGTYSFVLVNNCTAVDLRVAVTGVVRVNAS